MSKSLLRRLSHQMSEKDQAQLLAGIFSEDVLKQALDFFKENEELTQSFEYHAWFDGGSKGNPGPMYTSFRIETPSGDPVFHSGIRNEETGTNNEAEYRALIRCLDFLEDRLGTDSARASLTLFSDSQLVVSQVAGTYKCNPKLIHLRDNVRVRFRLFEKVILEKVPKEVIVEKLGH